MTTAPLFICHAFTESAFAGDLSLALEAYRFPVWQDKHQLRGSERLAPDVRWALEQAAQVIVILGLNTPDAAWLRREIEIAQETERRRSDSYRVIPLLLPGCDPKVLHDWFTPLPRSAAISVDAEGMGAALPALLTALGAMPPLPLERHAPSLPTLTITWGAQNCTAQLSSEPSATELPINLPSKVQTFPPRLLRWYWQEHPRWPIDRVRQLAAKTAALLHTYGRTLDATLFADAALHNLRTTWSARGERQLILNATHIDATTLENLALPWELLADSNGFLIQHKQPVAVQRRLPGKAGHLHPTTIPLRILVLSPRPDTEPTGHAHPWRSALPLYEATQDLGALLHIQVLFPPTQALLEKTLNEAWAAGCPLEVLHLDAHLHILPHDTAPSLALEAEPGATTDKCRQAQFMPQASLVHLLATYRMRLVVISGSGANTQSLVADLLQAGIAAVIVVHPQAAAETMQRFWAAFYEELLRGARIGQAVFAGQRRLASDSYRAQGLGGGGVQFHDWYAVQLYRGDQDPRLLLRPPLEMWRRLSAHTLPGSLGRLPPMATVGFVGRGRSLQILERLISYQPALFIRGNGNCGKTACAVALATWLQRCGRYPYSAYLGDDDAINPQTLVESLAHQLLAGARHWSISSYQGIWQAVDYLVKNLPSAPILILLDNIEQWSAEHDESMERFWKTLLDARLDVRLLGIGRLGPPSFAAPWREVVLGPLDAEDAMSLMSRTLIAHKEIPPVADSGTGFAALCDLVRMVGASPGVVQRLAHAVGQHGVAATFQQLSAMRSRLLRRKADDAQWPMYLGVELALQKISSSDRHALALLGFVKGGIHRLALTHSLEFDTQRSEALCKQLIALDLATDKGYGYLRIEPALSSYIYSQLNAAQRSETRITWRAAMDYLLSFLYRQYFKDSPRTLRLLRLELPNMLALLRDCHSHPLPERNAWITSQLEPLLAQLGIPSALAEAVAMRERAGTALAVWNGTRFEMERLRIERLRDKQALEEALQAARQLLAQAQEAGPDAYPGATYDLGRAHFELGKLLKQAGAAEPALRELTNARQQFHILAEHGNNSAVRMAAVADAEIGDCLTYLQRLQDAASAYEAALAKADAQSAGAANDRLQLGLVYQRQGKYAAAAETYAAAQRSFEHLGEMQAVALAARHLSMAYKLGRNMEAALQAGQRALYLYEQQRNRRGTAEVLGEVGQLHQVLNQLEAAVLAYRRMAELYQQLGDGRNEEASRNRLANALIQLRRPDEARQELYRASECNLPESQTARNWAIRRGMRDISQAVADLEIADQARYQAIQKYLAYRRAGGENTNPGVRLCVQIGDALRDGNQETIQALVAKLEQTAASPNVPVAGKLLITKLRAILKGDRSTALIRDAELHYQYAAELQLLLEELAELEG